MSPAEKLADEDHLFAGSCRLDTTLFQNLPKKVSIFYSYLTHFDLDLIQNWLDLTQIWLDLTQIWRSWTQIWLSWT